MANARQGKKGKRKDERPARKAYWLKRQLEKNKVRRLVKHGKMNYMDALRYWQKVRQARVPANFVRKGACHGKTKNTKTTAPARTGPDRDGSGTGG